jgi:two-component system response regulator VicR
VNILVVDDDRDIADIIGYSLRKEGHRPTLAYSGEEALALAERSLPDLVVLDVMLPGLSGFDVCRKLRERGPVPVILLTARGEEADRVWGLDLGADDYVTKPFGLRELTARVHALLRRNRPSVSSDDRETTFGDCTVDPKTFELRRGQQSLALSAREVKLFQLFISHPDEVLSRDRILNEIWGYEYYGTTRTLDQAIVQLRKKLADVGADPKQIATVHTVGYRWTQR